MNSEIGPIGKTVFLGMNRLPMIVDMVRGINDFYIGDIRNNLPG